MKHAAMTRSSGMPICEVSRICVYSSFPFSACAAMEKRLMPYISVVVIEVKSSSIPPVIRPMRPFIAIFISFWSLYSAINLYHSFDM